MKQKHFFFTFDFMIYQNTVVYSFFLFIIANCSTDLFIIIREGQYWLWAGQKNQKEKNNDQKF